MVGESETHAQDRCGGRFFGRRVNCEQVPVLPAWAVAQMLDDPRKMIFELGFSTRPHRAISLPSAVLTLLIAHFGKNNYCKIKALYPVLKQLLGGSHFHTLSFSPFSAR